MSCGPACIDTWLGQAFEAVRGVHQRVAIWHRQNAVDFDMLVKQVDDIARLHFGIDVVDPDGLEGDKVDDRGKLVLDPMVQFVQQGSSLQCGRKG